MIKKYFCYTLFLVQLLIISSCSQSINENPISIQPEYLNAQILIRAPQYANTYNTRDSIILEMKNNSSHTITFPRDYNIKLFEDSKEGWIPIKEKPTQRTPPDDIVLSPNEESPVVQPIIIFPDLPDINRGYKLRIYVIGTMQENDELKEVGAFTDIVLSP